MSQGGVDRLNLLAHWWVVTFPDGKPYAVRTTLGEAERYANNLGPGYYVVEVAAVNQPAGAVARIAKLEALLAQAYRVVGNDEFASDIDAALHDADTGGQ